MTNLFRKIAVGTALAGILLTGSASAGEIKVIGIPYYINKSARNLIFLDTKLMEEKYGKRVVEIYSKGYTGDLGAGESLEEAADIENENSDSFRCIKVDSSGKFKGSNVHFGPHGRKVSQKLFDESVKKADVDNDGHVSEEESIRHQWKIAEENAHRYPDCDNPEFKYKMFLERNRRNRA